jgi:serralysin
VKVTIADGVNSAVLRDLGTVGLTAMLPQVREVMTNPVDGRLLFVVEAPPSGGSFGDRTIYTANGLGGGSTIFSLPGFDNAGRDAGDLRIINNTLIFTAYSEQVRAPGSPAGSTSFIQGARELWAFDLSNPLALPRQITSNPADDEGFLPTGLVRVGNSMLFAGDAGFPTGRELWGWDPVGGLRLVKDFNDFAYDKPADPDTLFYVLRAVQDAFAIAGIFGFDRAISGPLGIAYSAINKAVNQALTRGYKFENIALPEVSNLLISHFSADMDWTFSAAGGLQDANGLIDLRRLWTNLWQTADEDYYGSGLAGSENLFAFGNQALFRAVTKQVENSTLPTRPVEVGALWVTDGTTGGTRLLRDNLSNLLIDPGNFMLLPNNKVVFGAGTDGSARSLYITDGTQAGTVQLLRNLDPGFFLNKSDFGVVGNKIVFAGSSPFDNRDFRAYESYDLANNTWVYDLAPNAGREVWISDGTERGTFLLKDLVPGELGSDPRSFASMAGGVFFTAGPPDRRALWFTDGTTAGTYKVQDGVTEVSTGSVADTVAPTTTLNDLPTKTNAADVTFRGVSASVDAVSVNWTLTGPADFTTQTGSAPIAVFNKPWSVTRDLPLEGTYTFSARAVDSSGNIQGTPITETFVVDRTPPDTALVAAPGFVTGNRYLVSGTATAGDATEVRVTFGDETGRTVVKTVAVAADGSWTAEVDTSLVFTSGQNGTVISGQRPFEGPGFIRAVAVDAAGNVDASAAAQALTIDFTAPGVFSTVLASNGGPVLRRAVGTVPIASDSVDAVFLEVTFTGPTLPPETVTLATNGWDVIGIAPTTGFNDGLWTISARATDAAGLVGPTSNWQMLVDNTPPTIGLDTVVPTFVTTGTFTLSGTTSADANRVFVSWGAPGGTTSFIAPPSSGSWSTTLTNLADGQHFVRFMAGDALNNYSDWQETRFIVDRTPPDTAITGVRAGVLRGTASGDAASVRLTLTGPDGSIEGREVTTVAGTGGQRAWSTIVPATEGAWTVRAVATDGARNVDPSAATLSFTLDITAPDTTITGPVTRIPIGTANITGTVVGPDAAEAVIRRYDWLGDRDEPGNLRETATVTTGTSGSYARAFASLAEGTHYFTVAGVDSSGNEDRTPAVRLVTVDLTAPSTTISHAGNSGGRGIIQGSTFEDDLAKVTLRLVDPLGAETLVELPGELRRTDWSYTLPDRTPGIWTVTAFGTDRAGNVEVAAAPASFTFAPIPDTAIGTGPVQDPANPRSVVVAGTATPGVATQVLLTLDEPDGTTRSNTVSVAADGSWSIVIPTATGTAEGAWSVSAVARNADGQFDATPATRSFVIDLTAPDTTLGTVPTTSNATELLIAGTATAGDATLVRLTITPPGATAGTVTVPVAADGSWSYLAPILAQGQWRFSAAAQDAVGNVDFQPATATTIINRLLPDIVLNPIAAETTASRVSITGSVVGAPNTSYTITQNATAPTGALTPVVQTRFTDANGVASFSSAVWPGDFTQGNWTVSLSVRDAAGNADPTPASFSFFYDGTAPNTTITALPARFATSELDIFGTATAGDAVLVRLSGTGIPTGTTVPVAADGSWSYRMAGLAPGSVSVSAAAVDRLGNVDLSPASRSSVMDLTAPETTYSGGVPARNNGTISLQGSASGDGDVAGVELVMVSPTGQVTTQQLGSSWRLNTTLTGDGRWSWSAAAYDTLGNKDQTPVTGAFVVDRTAPEAVVTIGPTLSRGAGERFAGTVDADAVEIVARWGSAQQAFIPVTGGAWSWVAPNAFNTGPVTITFEARDSLFNTDQTPTSYSFVADNTAPSLTMASLLGQLASVPARGTAQSEIVLSGQTFSNANRTNLPGTTSDVVLVSFVATAPDGTQETFQVVPAADGSWSRTVQLTADGTWSFGSVRAMDAAGNLSSVSSSVETLLRDTTPPDTAINAPPTLTGASTVTLTGPLLGQSLTSQVTNDALPPVLTITRPDGTTETVTAGYQGGTAWTHLINVSTQPDGVWTVRAASTDRLGNTDPTPAEVSFAVDRTPPSTSFGTLPSLTNAQQIQVTGTASVDAASVALQIFSPDAALRRTVNVAVTEGRWDYTLDTPTQGNWTLYAWATDVLGNTATSQARADFTIGRGTPETLIDSGLPTVLRGATTTITGSTTILPGTFGPGAFANEVDVEVTSAGGVTQFVTVPVSASTSRWSASFFGLADGEWTVSATGRSLIDNVDPTPATRLITVDRTPPETTLAVTDASTNLATYSINGTATAGLASEVVLTILQPDGKVTTRTVGVGANGSWAATLSDLAPEQATIVTAQARDADGNADFSPAMMRIINDTVAPDTIITTPIQSATMERLLVEGRVDGADATQVFLNFQHLLHGTILQRTATVNEFGRFSYELANASLGPWRIEAAAQDEAGNRDATPAFRNIQLSERNDPPVVTSAATVAVSEGLVDFFYQATGTDREGQSLIWSISGADAQLFRITSDGALQFLQAPDFEVPADTNGDNSYEITLTAFDGVNSTPLAVTITVTNENEAPIVTSAASATLAENRAADEIVYQGVANDPDGSPSSFSWSLSGIDAALFTVDATTGAVRFKAASDFEAPRDSGSDNVYDITVTASDGSLSSTARTVAITVTDVNDVTPFITSGAAASFAENGTGTVYQATGSDPDAGTTLSWSLGGADAALFEINADSGAVTFVTAPNFEAPDDAGGDNVYDITVTATDGTLSSTAQAVAITVTNVNEVPNGSVSFTHLGGTLRATNTLTDTDGLGVISYTWQSSGDTGATWQAIDGANSADFTPDASVAGRLVRVVASYLDGSGAAESIASGSMARIGTSGADDLTAGAGVTALFGLGGSDTLTGMAASQTLDGGAGDDMYLLHDALDFVLEGPGGGADTIMTWMDMTLPDHVEMAVIAPNVSGITVTGGAGNDMLIGNGLSNGFNGGAGDDVILVGNVTLADIYALFAA